MVVKDNVALSGVPMMNGSQMFEGYVPDIDATVVTRILDAGGTIIGKAANTDLCFDGGSATTRTGMTENPHKKGYSAGGSSCGSAALVSIGEADMALGGDQGGSIRIPACWSGVYGLKVTHGLVPYTGVFPIEMTLDHVGPLAGNVTDVATLLQVIAGPDGYDPRQIGTTVQNYTQHLNDGVKGMTIGLVKEGFGHPNSEKDVDASVKKAVNAFKKLGAKVKQISIPMHLDGPHIWSAVAIEGATELMMKGNGYGTNWEGYYNVPAMNFYGQTWRARPNDLSETVKLVMLLGEYMKRYYNGRYYGKAQNLRYSLVAAYDQALAECDLLAMPTLPLKATKLPAPYCSREDYVDVALNMLANTCPFDTSGHPAINVPCGMSNGLPIGLMLIGRRYDEARILRAAKAFEGLGNWKKM